MQHPLQCMCGKLQGFVKHIESVNHGICYCKDCQVFAHFLGHPDKILDDLGGTEIVQTTPANVIFTHGKDLLDCMRLTDKGLLRWYTRCCKTPIGNTLPTPKLSFVGLVHNCLNSSGAPLDSIFGPVSMWVNRKNARVKVKQGQTGTFRGAARFIAMVVRARINGDYQNTPFFHKDLKSPVVSPTVLTAAERAELMRAVSQH